MSTNGACYSSSWTREQDKAFETGLAIIPEDDFYRWQKIAEMVPGKTVEEIKCHYEILVEDINAIELDLVLLPCYDGSLENDYLNPSNDFGSEGWQFGKMQKTSTSRRKSSKSKRERRKKGIAWTEEEHRLFLEGLAKYGRGDWRSISRLCVISRTPTQVASHAQKYFMRLNSSTNEKRRPSINDITDKGKAVESSDPLPPIKAQAAKAAGRSSSKKSRLQALSCDPDDISNFVPPTIVQSSYDLATELAGPTAVAFSQKETVQDDMALSPDSFFACLPEITKLF